MPFDYIMGVGKTPEVTKNTLSNPYTVNGEEITNLCSSNITLSANHYIVTGSIINITNPLFDYNNFDAIQIGTNSANPATSYINFDLAKDITLRAIEIYFYLRGQNGEIVSLTVQTSLNGVDWNTVASQSKTSSGTDVYYTLTANSIYCRNIRLVCTGNGGSGTPWGGIKVMKIWQSPISYLY